MEAVCLYCRQPSTHAPPEHVIPEALGCPEGAILREGEVCHACNNGIAHLDLALVDAFDFARLAVRQPGKKGKGTRVAGRPNFRAAVNNGHIETFVNMGPDDVRLPDGHVLKAPDKSPRSVQVEFTTDGVTYTAKMTAQMFQHPKFVRALYKVGLESIAVMLGREAALDTSLDEARHHVLNGDGLSRRAVCFFPDSGWKYENRLWSPYTSKHGYTAAVRLAGIDFVLDCSPGQGALPALIDALSFAGYNRRWSVLRDPVRDGQ